MSKTNRCVVSSNRFAPKAAACERGRIFAALLALVTIACIVPLMSCAPGDFVGYVFTAPSTTSSGAAFTVKVNAEDNFGNVVPSYNGTVHFTSSDPTAVVPPDYTFTSADQGVHTFTNGFTLKTVGKQTITGTDTRFSNEGGRASINVVIAGNASQLKVTAPSTATTGSAFTTTITAEDANGNAVPGYTGTVHFSSSDSAATLPPNYTFTSADSGSHTFTNGFTLQTVGSQTITATDTTTSTITGSATIAASNAVPVVSQLLLSAPSTANAGVPFTATVKAADSGGNVVPSYLGTVHFSSSDTAAVVPANYTFTSADQGSHAFTNGFTLKTQGAQTISVSDTVTSSIGGSTPITLQGPVLQSIAVTPANSSISYGSTEQFTATGTYSDGSTQNVTTQATWASSQTAVATISNASGTQGLATSVAAGPTTISATVGPVSGSTSLLVTIKLPTTASRYLLSQGQTNLSVEAIVPSTGQLRVVTAFDVTQNGLNYPSAVVAHPNGQVAYVVTIPTAGLQIATYSLGLSGMMTAIGSPVSSQTYSGTPVVDPLGRFLYAEDFSDIYALPLDPQTGVPGTAANAASGVSSPGAIVIDPTGTYLFAQTGGTVTSYQINGSTGALTQVGTPVIGATSTTSLIISPSGKLLYELDPNTHVINAYSVTQGVLTVLTNSPFAISSSGLPERILIDPSGSFLYLTEESSDALFGFTIAADGSLTPMQSGSSFAVGIQPSDLSIDASGSYLYLNNFGSRETWVYSIASGTGLLTQTSKMRNTGQISQALINGAVGLAFTPSTFLLANEASGDVSQFFINASTGELSPMTVPSVGAGSNPETVATDPFGFYAYVPSLNANDLPSYSLTSSGLTAISAPATGNGASWATTDLSGSFLYVPMEKDNTIWGYPLASGVEGTPKVTSTTSTNGPSFIVIDPTGQFLYITYASDALIDTYTPSQGGVFPVGETKLAGIVRWIAIDPSGQFLYAADPAHNVISQFTINGFTGALTADANPVIPLGGSTAVPGASSLVAEPSGKYVYATNESSDQIFGFSIDPRTGQLSYLNTGNALATTGTTPMALGVDVSGQYLYCVNQGSNDISIFSIDLSTGALTQVGASTVQAGGTQPNGFALIGTRN